jgi:enoyl-CoA hydratase/carnithine racemase
VLRHCCFGAPNARAVVKREINAQYGLYDRMSMEESLASAEAAEGWRAFAERRAPSWIPPDLRPEGRL